MWGPILSLAERLAQKAGAVIGSDELRGASRNSDPSLYDKYESAIMEPILQGNEVLPTDPRKLEDHVKHLSYVPNEGQDFTIQGKLLGFDLGDPNGPGGARVIPNPLRYMPDLHKYWDYATTALSKPVNDSSVGSVGTEDAGQNYVDFVNSTSYNGVLDAINLGAKYTAEAGLGLAKGFVYGTSKAIEGALDAGDIIRDGAVKAYDVLHPYVDPALNEIKDVASKGYDKFGESLVDFLKIQASFTYVTRRAWEKAKEQTDLTVSRIDMDKINKENPANDGQTDTAGSTQPATAGDGQPNSGPATTSYSAATSSNTDTSSSAGTADILDNSGLYMG